MDTGCIKTAADRDLWISTLVNAIARTHTRYFRWHDSGDIFSAVYGRCILDVCRQLPRVKHWIPTRSYQNGRPAAVSPFIVLNEHNGILQVLRDLASMPNVIVRPSSLYIGDSAPIVPGLHAGSTVNSPGAFQCRAPRQNGECRTCRTRWNRPDVPVSYALH
jgi:hypothetical protein